MNFLFWILGIFLLGSSCFSDWVGVFDVVVFCFKVLLVVVKILFDWCLVFFVIDFVIFMFILLMIFFLGICIGIKNVVVVIVVLLLFFWDRLVIRLFVVLILLLKFLSIIWLLWLCLIVFFRLFRLKKV